MVEEGEETMMKSSLRRGRRFSRFILLAAAVLYVTQPTTPPTAAPCRSSESIAPLASAPRHSTAQASVFDALRSQHPLYCDHSVLRADLSWGYRELGFLTRNDRVSQSQSVIASDGGSTLLFV